MKQEKKFSLIELLVVVAIIGILASFLLPTLKKARDSARRASCMSQEKQIGIAFTMYHGDNDGYFPVYGSHKDNVAWDDQLGDYDGRKLTQAQKELQQIGPNDGVNNSLYQCPGSIQERDNHELKSYSISRDAWKDMSDDQAVRGIAGWTQLLDDGGATIPDADGDPTTSGWSIAINQIVAPNNMIAMMEVHNDQNLMGYSRSGNVGYHSMGNVTSSFSPIKLPSDGAVKGGIAGFYVHDPSNYKMNFLYTDGHVEFKSPANTVGSWRDNFYTGTWTGVWEMQHSGDTQWNALD